MYNCRAFSLMLWGHGGIAHVTGKQQWIDTGQENESVYLLHTAVGTIAKLQNQEKF